MSDASLAEIEIPPGRKHETARSIKSEKVYIIREGKISFRVEGRLQNLETGDALLIKRGEWFDYHNFSSKTARVLLVHIPAFDLNNEEFRNKPDKEV